MNYYNEFDPKAAAWLRELIKQGLIPAGDVDERSITEIKPDELTKYTQCHFFAGIGGWSYALWLAGWPSDRPVWTGSCPCQPFSSAGKQLGTADERHLWPAFFNLIRQCRPESVFGEQVATAIGKGWLDGVSADLESEGYACGAAVLGAHSVGAPHIRQRLYWVADATASRFPGAGEGTGNRQRSDQDPQRGFGIHEPSCGSTDCGLAITESQGRAGMEPELQAGVGIGSRAGCDCTAGRLATPHGGHSSAEREQCGGEHGQQPQDGGAGGLEHTPGDGWQQRGSESGGRGTTGGCGTGGLVHPIQPRLEGLPRDGDNRDQPGRLNPLATGSTATAGSLGHWGAYDLIPCTDGKTRRIEPSSFPLAHGVPGRVGLLRGYGNAIVPQVAAAFIEATY